MLSIHSTPPHHTLVGLPVHYLRVWVALCLPCSLQFVYECVCVCVYEHMYIYVCYMFVCTWCSYFIQGSWLLVLMLLLLLLLMIYSLDKICLSRWWCRCDISYLPGSISAFNQITFNKINTTAYAIGVEWLFVVDIVHPPLPWCNSAKLSLRTCTDTVYSCVAFMKQL